MQTSPKHLESMGGACVIWYSGQWVKREALNESMTYQIWLAKVGTVWIIQNSIEVKFFFGDKYSICKFVVIFFKFVLYINLTWLK